MARGRERPQPCGHLGRNIFDISTGVATAEAVRRAAATLRMVDGCMIAIRIFKGFAWGDLVEIEEKKF